MNPIKIATAQFEHKSGDKAYNLGVIRRLSLQAAAAGAAVVTFHECSVTGYSFARHLFSVQLLELAEHIPGGPSVEQLTAIAREAGMRTMYEDGLSKALSGQTTIEEVLRVTEES